MNQLASDIGNLLTAPFVGEIDLIQLFWIIGAVLVIAALWFFILEHMRQAGQVVGEAL